MNWKMIGRNKWMDEFGWIKNELNIEIESWEFRK